MLSMTRLAISLTLVACAAEPGNTRARFDSPAAGAPADQLAALLHKLSAAPPVQVCVAGVNRVSSISTFMSGQARRRPGAVAVAFLFRCRRARVDKENMVTPSWSGSSVRRFLPAPVFARREARTPNEGARPSTHTLW